MVHAKILISQPYIEIESGSQLELVHDIRKILSQSLTSHRNSTCIAVRIDQVLKERRSAVVFNGLVRRVRRCFVLLHTAHSKASFDRVPATNKRRIIETGKGVVISARTAGSVNRIKRRDLQCKRERSVLSLGELRSVEAEPGIVEKCWRECILYADR